MNKRSVELYEFVKRIANSQKILKFKKRKKH